MYILSWVGVARPKCVLELVGHCLESTSLECRMNGSNARKLVVPPQSRRHARRYYSVLLQERFRHLAGSHPAIAF